MSHEIRYTFVLTRRDLTIEQQMVQSIHSAIEAARHGLIPSDQDHPHLVLCSVKNELALKSYIDRLEAAGIPYRTFSEPDLSNELTAVATAPVDAQQKRLFRNLQLLVAERS